jgi:hypothetical protein
VIIFLSHREQTDERSPASARITACSITRMKCAAIAAHEHLVHMRRPASFFAFAIFIRQCQAIQQHHTVAALL